MDDFNFKKIKQVVSGYFEPSHSEKKGKSGIKGGGIGSRIIPILAHSLEEPVTINNEVKDQFFQDLQPSEYNFVATLIRKGDLLLATIKTYLIENNTEVPLSIDEQVFMKHEKNRVVDFITTPNRVFDVKKAHKRIITFKRTKMTEDQFEKVIRKWRKAPPTTN